MFFLLRLKFNPNWLRDNPAILDTLLELWRARTQRISRADEAMQPLFYSREAKLLVACFLNYCRAHKEQVNVLFMMLTVFSQRSTIDYQFLREFYTKEINETYSIEQRRGILSEFVRFYSDASISQVHVHFVCMFIFGV